MGARLHDHGLRRQARVHGRCRHRLRRGMIVIACTGEDDHGGHASGMERGAGLCTGPADLIGQGRDLVRHARAEAEDRVGGLRLGLRSWPCDLHQHHHGDTGGVEQKNGAEEPPDPCHSHSMVPGGFDVMS